MKEMLISACSVAIIIASSAAAVAQTDSASDVIVVTAQKREQSANDVPIALTAVSGDTLEASGISDLSQTLPYIPGLSGSTAGVATNSWNIRGIGTNDWTIGSEPAVAVFLDDAYIGRNVNATASFFDIERIEVLRGPQGTLFGRNASAGAINVITRKPQDVNKLELGIGYGNQEQLHGSVTGNAAITDNFKVRAAYRAQTEEGIQFAEGVDEDYFTDSHAARLSALWNIGPDTEILLSGHYNTFKSNRNRTHNAGLAGLLGLAGGDDPFADRTTADSPSFEEADIWGVNGRITHDFNDSLRITSITDWRTWDYAFSLDVDGFGAPLVVDFGDLFLGAPGTLVTTGSPHFFQPDVGSDSISQEVRLNGAYESIDWLIGASVFREDLNENAFLAWPTTFDADSLLGGGGVFPVMTMADPAAYMTEGENTSIGIYGDVVLRPVDRLALTGGLRWTKDKKEFCATNVDPTFGFLQILGPDTLGQSICDTQKSDKVTYRGVIDFHAAADVLIYASYATGYKGGGFNSSVLGSGLFGIDPPFTLASFDPETSKSAEIGVKAGLFNGDGQLNIALYKTKYKDLQLLDTGLSLRIDNIANVDSDGAEVEFSLRPTSIEELSISTSYAFNDSKIDAPGLAIDGSVLNAAPKHTFAGTLQYAHDIGSLGEIAWFFGYTWQDDIIFDINGARVPQEAYGVADASVRFTPRNGRFDLTFRANNIFDKEYLISGQDPLALGLPTTGRADPFMFMFQLKAYFGDR